MARRVGAVVGNIRLLGEAVQGQHELKNLHLQELANLDLWKLLASSMESCLVSLGPCVEETELDSCCDLQMLAMPGVSLGAWHVLGQIIEHLQKKVISGY